MATGADAPLNAGLMDVDDDIISSPRAPSTLSHRSVSGDVTPALGLARAALVLCAVFAVSTIYLLVVVQSHATKIDTLQEQQHRYQAPQPGRSFVDHEELENMVQGLLGGYVNTTTLENIVHSLATATELHDAKAYQTNLYEVMRQVQNDTANQLTLKADSQALNNLREDMTAGDSRNLNTVTQLIDAKQSTFEQSIQNLAASKADQNAFVNLTQVRP